MRILAEAGADLGTLEPLSQEAVAQIAIDVLGAEPDADLLKKTDRLQGSPFLVVEFFRGLFDDGIVSIKSGRAVLTEDRLPPRVSNTIRGPLPRRASVS